MSKKYRGISTPKRRTESENEFFGKNTHFGQRFLRIRCKYCGRIYRSDFDYQLERCGNRRCSIPKGAVYAPGGSTRSERRARYLVGDYGEPPLESSWLLDASLKPVRNAFVTLIHE